MSLNLFLIQLVLFTSVFMLVQAPRLPRGWLAVTGIILAVLAVSFAIAPDWAGIISGTVWLWLFLLPLLGAARVNRLVSQERYRAARQWATLVKWLHPVDGMVEYPRLLRGLELGQRGRLDEARHLFSQFEHDNTPSGRMATILLFRLNGNWEQLVRWVEETVSETTLYQELGLAVTYLRALGELGRLNELLQGVATLEQRSARRGSPILLNTARLYALVFCGQVESVKLLLNGALAVYASQTRQFWIATAELITGRRAIAQAMLEELRQSPDHMLRQAVQQRLARPAINPLRILTDTSRQHLNHLKTTVAQEARYSGWGALGRKQCYTTYVLIGLNLLVFGWALRQGGTDDIEVLYRLGALVPEDVIAGQGWRLFTALFLHAGWLHLGANMLGLLVFGSGVENVLGWRKFLVCYFFSGLGSMLTVTMVGLWTQTFGQLTVGASGAVLGLVGAEAAIQLQGWRVEKASVARDRLRLIGIIILLQLGSDLITPQVSVIGHLSGVILGFLSGLVLFKLR
jgi:rhomboid protease GluP